MPEVLGSEGQAPDESWYLYGIDGQDDLHDMNGRMRETHELSRDCWCHPIPGRDVLRTYHAYIWTHIDKEENE